MSLGMMEIEMGHLEDAKNSFISIDQLSELWKVTIPDLTLLHALSLLHCGVWFQMRKEPFGTIMFMQKAKSIKDDIHEVVNKVFLKSHQFFFYFIFSFLCCYFF